METKLIVKYIALVLVIAAFGGIIFGIAKMFASQCSDGYTYYKDQKKCIKDCETGYHYDKNMKCIPTCDAGKTYFEPPDDKCSECEPGALDAAGNALVRHPDCGDGGLSSCGPDCSKREEIDPTGLLPGEKIPAGSPVKPGDRTKALSAQGIDCGTNKCVCGDGYEMCAFAKGDPNYGVCYNPKLAVCNEDHKVVPCKKICRGTEGIQCCKDPADTCCPTTGQCCPTHDGAYCAQDGTCCKKGTTGVTSGGCCLNSHVYCKKGEIPTFDTTTKTMTCSTGDTECCVNSLCFVNNTLKCCDSESGPQGCGQSSLCGLQGQFPSLVKGSPANGRCIGAILGDCDRTDTENCLCVNRKDKVNLSNAYKYSSFAAVGPGGKCSLSNETPTKVILNHTGDAKDPDKCTSDDECVGFSDVNQTCYAFSSNSWGNFKTKATSCKGDNIAYSGKCLTKCDGTSNVYCPGQDACETDTTSNITYCRSDEGIWGTPITWPPDLDNKQTPLWAQVYTPPSGTTHCPAGVITCDPSGSNKCPPYLTLNLGKDGGFDSAQLDCVPDSDGKGGFCQAPVEKNVAGDVFCRVNYQSPGTPEPSGDLDNLSFLGNNLDQACPLLTPTNPPTPCEGCTSANFGHWLDTNMLNPFCGAEENHGGGITTMAFPYWSNSETGYDGPLRDGSTPPGGVQSWGCGGGNFARQAECAASGSAEPPYYYGELDSGKYALMNPKDWSKYHIMKWRPTSDSQGDMNSCYDQAISATNGQKKLARVRWDDEEGICTAQFEPGDSTTNNPCDGSSPHPQCISALTNEEEKPFEFWTHMQESQCFTRDSWVLTTVVRPNLKRARLEYSPAEILTANR